MSDRALLLGADIGTTAAKAGLFDLAGNPLALADSGYAIERPQPDWAEQDPRVWWQAFVDVVDALGAEADLSRVRAVGICSQVNTHVFVDADGADLAPAIVWQDQRRRSSLRRWTPGPISTDRVSSSRGRRWRSPERRR